MRVTDNYGKPVYGNKFREEMRNNSAYMLMYKRKGSGTTTTATSAAACAATGMKNKEWSTRRKELLNKIWHDNDLSMRTGMLFDPNFLTFMRDLLVMSSQATAAVLAGGAGDAGGAGGAGGVAVVVTEDQSEAQSPPPQPDDSIVSSAYEFFTTVVVKAKDKKDIDKWTKVLSIVVG